MRIDGRLSRIACQVPDLDLAANVPASEVGRGRVVGEAAQRRRVPAIYPFLPAAAHIPQSYRAVRAGSGDLRPIGPEGNSVHNAGMAAERVHQLAVSDVP